MSYEIDTRCPKCDKYKKGFEQIQINYIRHLKCNKCGHIFNDEETTKAYGLRKCSDGSYESNGNKWMLYPCPYCMEFFKTFNEEQEHQYNNHKIGDHMVCCEP